MQEMEVGLSNPRVCRRLRAEVAERISSAARIPSYEYALGLVLINAVEARPASVIVVLNFPKRGFTVVDNGEGISDPNSLSCLALLKDLGQIARVHIGSRHRDSRRVISMEIAHGISTATSVKVDRAFPFGTRIEISELFTNLPVRRKALDAALANASGMHNSVVGKAQQIALLHSTIRWVINDGPRNLTILSTRPLLTSDLQQSFSQLFGKSCPGTSFGTTLGQCRVRGLLWSWDLTAGDPRLQLIYVNGEPADIPSFNRWLQNLVSKGRRILQCTATWPVSIVLEISCPVDIVVRVPSENQLGCSSLWSDGTFIPESIVRCIRGGLIPAIDEIHPEIARSPSVRSALNSPMQSSSDCYSKLKTPYQVDHFMKAAGSQGTLIHWTGLRASSAVGKPRFCGRDGVNGGFPTLASSSAPLSIVLNRTMLSNIRVLRQVDKKFIIAILMSECPIIVAIDQHAADERVRLEQIQSEMKSWKGSIPTQICSPPVALDWADIDLSALDKFKGEVSAWGFQVVGSSRQIGLRRVPVVFGERLNVDDLLGLVKELHRTNGSSLCSPPRLNSILNSKACRSAIMFGDKLTTAQCEELLAKLAKCQFPFQCAHGRPSIVPIGCLERPDRSQRK